MKRLRRAMLFVPGDSKRKLEKGASVAVDSVILDLEDGVGYPQKAEARQHIAHALQNLAFSAAEKWIRINPVGSGLEEADLAETINAHPDGYVLPKAESAEQLKWVDHWLATAEQAHDWEIGSILLSVLIETARGVVNLKEIASATPRLQALIFGAGDFTSDIGALRTDESTLYANSALITHAKAFGLQAIDTPYLDIKKLDGLAADTRRSMALGYDGRTAIHPSHVPVIEQAYQPPQEAVERALALLDAYDQQIRDGKGVFTFEGKMVDMPDFRAAQNILARAGIHREITHG